ncbi:hypothetical protein [Clostridium sp.]|uniref:hypothetical protein n=1 Tax=Clostridium sp. TaxID=1506 RepID=UPI001A406070|nr:hypothetical protein [Clostridium sp.]MBK5235971.1 hypothetical protein [Clostridium sp.]
MKILKFIAISILFFLGIIILAIVIALTTLITFFLLQSLIFCRGNYLLFISSPINMVPSAMIMVLIIYLFFQLIEKFFKGKDRIVKLPEEVDTAVVTDYQDKILLDDLNNNKLDIFLVQVLNIITKVYKIIKKCYLPALIIAIYCGMTSYTILYSDSIKIGSPISPIGVLYSYSDIKSVNVCIVESKDSYDPSYKITLKNNKTTDLLGGGSMDSNDQNFEEVLVNLDSVLKNQGVQKTIDKKDFDKFSKGLDASFVKEVEKLFNKY